MSGMHLSKEFFELIKAIGESKSKQEEDRIIQREITTLKKKMETNHSGTSNSSSSVVADVKQTSNRKKAKEFLVRMLYVEMLGHDASFGYIKAVEMAASSSIVHKRTGYLLCSVTLSPSHEFRFMLVNQMQRDLNSSNLLEVCAALLAVCDLITEDMVPAVLNDVIKLLDHNSDLVRKKAIITLYKCFHNAPDCIPYQDLVDKLRRVLCDRDPSVMASSLNVIEIMAKANTKPFKDLVSSLISILKQVMEHRLPTDYDYHRIPAPWIQMKIIRILSLLGKNDIHASEGMYEILHEAMRKADIGINAGYAVVYECVKTITNIYPNTTLLDAAADAISRFITSKSQNLRYLGVTGLAAIVQSHPQYAAAHQLSVIECLEDTDETLQRRTLDLLYKMTNPMNVTFITEKMLSFLKSTTDLFLKQDLTNKVCTLAERYAPNNLWYIETISDLFEISGDLVKPQVSQNVMTLIAEGGNDDDDDNNNNDDLLRQHTVTLYVNLLNKPHAQLPRLLIETMTWVLGEYAYLCPDYTPEQILFKLCTLVRKGKQLKPSTRKIILSAIMKLVAQAGTCPPFCAKLMDDFTKSKDFDLQLRCLEFQNLITKAPHLLGECLPIDASCEDVQVDVDLRFLDGYVQQAIQNGAREYERPEDDEDEDEDYVPAVTSMHKTTSSGFRLTPYEKPPAPGASRVHLSGVGSHSASHPHAPNGVNMPPGPAMMSPPGHNRMNSGSNTNTTGTGMNHDQPQLVLRNVANVWGKTPSTTNITSTSQTSPTTMSSETAPPNRGAFSTSSSWSAKSNITSTATTTTTTAQEPPVKTEEQIRKERMAAALFGGTVPGDSTTSSTTSIPRSGITKRSTATATTTRSVPVPTPAPAPSPAPEVDLLDLMSDVTPISTTQPPPSNFDLLTPTPIETPESAPPPPPAQAPQPPLDPFAASGLLDDVVDTPLSNSLSSFSNKRTFEYSGSILTPLKITTAQFGEKWGSCPHTTPFSCTTNQVETLDQFMTFCESIGIHPVEAIPATNEGICAGMLCGGAITILVHGKVSDLGLGRCRVDMTIKASDPSVGGCLALFLEPLLK